MTGSQGQINDICIITQNDISINCGFPQERGVRIRPAVRLSRAQGGALAPATREMHAPRVKKRARSEYRLCSLS
jgi:hypothetical protein